MQYNLNSDLDEADEALLDSGHLTFTGLRILT